MLIKETHFFSKVDPKFGLVDFNRVNQWSKIHSTFIFWNAKLLPTSLMTGLAFPAPNKHIEKFIKVFLHLIGMHIAFMMYSRMKLTTLLTKVILPPKDRKVCSQDPICLWMLFKTLSKYCVFYLPLKILDPSHISIVVFPQDE